MRKETTVMVNFVWQLWLAMNAQIKHYSWVLLEGVST